MLTQFYYNLKTRNKYSWGNLGLIISLAVLAPLTFCIVYIIISASGITGPPLVLLPLFSSLLFFIGAPLVAMLFEWIISKEERRVKEHKDRAQRLESLLKATDRVLKNYEEETNKQEVTEDYKYAYIPKGFVGFCDTIEDAPGFKFVTK